MANLTRRLKLDAALTLMLIFEMCYSLTGNTLHEAVGFALFLCVGIHLVLSRRWIAATIRTASSPTRNLSAKNKGLACVAGLLAIDMIALVTSSLIISNTLYTWGISLWMLNMTGLWTTVHIVSAYGLCVITALHLAMHWSIIARKLRVEYNPSRRTAIGFAMGAAATMGIIAIGRTVFANEADMIDAGDSDTVVYDSSSRSPKQAAVVVREKDSAEEDSEMPATESESQEAQTSSEIAGEEESEYSNEPDDVISEEPEVFEEDYTEEPEVFEEPEEFSDEEPVQESEPVGNCPLCHNHCPLSSPRCNRPYDAGLIG